MVLFALTALKSPSVFGADQKLIDVAKKEGSLILYHTMPRRVLKRLVQRFEEKYEIRVKWTRKGAGGIIRMITAERMAGALKCDVVGASDPTSFIRWKKEGVLQKYATPNTPQFLKGIAEPEGWYTPVRVSYVSMGISTERVKPEEVPKSWKDALDPKWKGRIAIVDPRKSGPARWWLGAMVSKFGWSYIEKLAENKPLLLKSASTAAVTLLNGEADLLAMATEHQLVRRAAKGEAVKPIYPKEGIIFKTSPIGICANARHPHAAKLWIDWESSAEGQGFISKYGGYPPGRIDVKSFYNRDPKFTDPANTITVDHKWFLKNKGDLMKKFGKIMAGKDNEN